MEYSSNSIQDILIENPLVMTYNFSSECSVLKQKKNRYVYVKPLSGVG